MSIRVQKNLNVEEYFLFPNTFYTFFVTWTNFKIYKYKSYFLLLLAFFITFYICPPEGPWLLSSRVLSTFAITSHQYNNTLHSWTPTNIMGCICKKSADIMSFRISFITTLVWTCKKRDTNIVFWLHVVSYGLSGLSEHLPHWMTFYIDDSHNGLRKE